MATTTLFAAVGNASASRLVRRFYLTCRFEYLFIQQALHTADRVFERLLQYSVLSEPECSPVAG